MSSVIPYNKVRYEVPLGNIDFDSGGDTFKIALMTDSYSPDVDNDDFWSDISADETSGTGYTAGGETLANQAVTREDANDRAVWDADDVVWSASTITAAKAVIYKDTGNPATSPLIGYMDFGGNRSSVASDLTILFDSSGILEF